MTDSLGTLPQQTPECRTSRTLHRSFPVSPHGCRRMGERLTLPRREFMSRLDTLACVPPAEAPRAPACPEAMPDERPCQGGSTAAEGGGGLLLWLGFGIATTSLPGSPERIPR